MGAIWLLHLPWWLHEEGLGDQVGVWPGWETRSRSSGGYDAIKAIGTHHTGGGGTLYGNAKYCWENAAHRPVGAILLGRNGEILVGAAGATNTQGRGGPYLTSKGWTSAHTANRYWLSIEAINTGTDPWPDPQQEAYLKLCAILCKKLDLDPTRDVVAHFEWTDRKWDQAGRSRWSPNGGKWDMWSFRSDIKTELDEPTRPPPPEGFMRTTVTDVADDPEIIFNEDVNGYFDVTIPGGGQAAFLEIEMYWFTEDVNVRFWGPSSRPPIAQLRGYMIPDKDKPGEFVAHNTERLVFARLDKGVVHGYATQPCHVRIRHVATQRP